ncbi:glycosyltransferase [Thermococcus sp. SY098]|uniref:glycosyltransferase n=1 Tax=Thermococcus sp. SY098 TaxID=3111325 RepID=UPI003B63B65B
MKTLIVIPAYNEELTIGSVVALAKKYGDVLVVDDGSKDRTSEIAESSAVKNKPTLNQMKYNNKHRQEVTHKKSWRD